MNIKIYIDTVNMQIKNIPPTESGKRDIAKKKAKGIAKKLLSVEEADKLIEKLTEGIFDSTRQIGDNPKAKDRIETHENTRHFQ